MANNYFQFKQFTIHQDRSAMKVTTDACLFGAWLAERVSRQSAGGSQQSESRRILDIGTGTGLLSLMLAQKTDLFIDTIEIDKDAYEQAKENIASSPWNERIKVLQGDARIFELSQQYDVIISNPPFYENELRSPDDKKNIAHHEGLPLNELLAIINKNLSVEGQFFLLLTYKRNTELRDLLLDHELAIQQMTFVRQSVNHDYFRIMLMGKLKTGKPGTLIDEISIRDDQQQYTKAFTDLLKDYYLYL